MDQKQSRDMPPPRSILLFGASGHIGGPAASLIAAAAPGVRLRLVTSREDQIAALRDRFPAAEAMRANYFDLDSLIRATDGIDAIFVVTPDFIDERTAMTNLVAAAKRGRPLKIVRLTGDPPHIHSERQVPPELLNWKNGVAVNHLRARAVLEDSGLPVVFVNIAAYYMDNFAGPMGGPIIQSRTLCAPYERRMNFIDPADVGAVVGKILLSTDRYQLGMTYHLDNGHDCLTFRAVAEMMSEVFGEPIAYDPTPEGFRTRNGAITDARFGAGMTDYVLAYMAWENTIQTIWRRTDILHALFGIEGRRLCDWLADNKARMIF